MSCGQLSPLAALFGFPVSVPSALNVMPKNVLFPFSAQSGRLKAGFGRGKHFDLGLYSLLSLPVRRYRPLGLLRALPT